MLWIKAVSYTHLDVYKRQTTYRFDSDGAATKTSGNDYTVEGKYVKVFDAKNNKYYLSLIHISPTVEELERRLTGRGTETAQVIADRLARAGEEAEGMGQYDLSLIHI